MITAGEMSRGRSRAAAEGRGASTCRGAGGPAAYFAEYVKQQLIDDLRTGRGLRRRAQGDDDDRPRPPEPRARTRSTSGSASAASRPAALVAIDPRDGRVLAMYGGGASARASSTSPSRASASPAPPSSRSCSRPRSTQGISPADDLRVRAAAHQPRRQALVGAQLRGLLPRAHRPLRRDHALRQRRLRAADGARRAEERRADGAPARDHQPARRATSPSGSASRPSTRSRWRARSRPSRTAASAWTAASSETGRAPSLSDRARREDRDQRARRGNEVLDPNENAILTSMLEDVVDDGTGQRAALDDRPSPARRARPRTTATPGSSGTRRSSPWPSGSATRTSCIPMMNQFEGGPVAGGTYPAVIWQDVRQARAAPHERGARVLPGAGYRVRQPRVRSSTATTSGSWTTATASDTREVLYVTGFAPDKRAPCKPNEVDVPPRRRRDARRRRRPGSYGMPLTPERDHPAGEAGRAASAIVVEQFPKAGRSRPGPPVRIVTRRRCTARVPDLVGLTLAAGADASAEARPRARDRVGRRRGGRARRPRAAARRAGRAAGKGMTVTLRVGPR